MNSSNLYKQDLQYAYDQLSRDFFYHKKILVTGATGMIGSCIVDVLLGFSMKYQLELSILAAGRSLERLKARFAYASKYPALHFIEMDFSYNYIPGFEVDYIIHGAGNADPVSFAQHPVETMLTNFNGTQNLIDIGLKNHLKKFLYISSGEIYGQPTDDINGFSEDYSGYLDYASPRSCYPAAKRATEVLCQSYISQYNLSCTIVRPCHIFGPTLLKTDSRAVSEFIRSAALGQDIVLKSAGLVERSHCYVVDAAIAILIVLSFGQTGQAYNISDKCYQMTIREFAETAAKAGGCHVVFQVPNTLEQKGYSNVKRAVLQADKIQELGWIPSSTDESKIVRAVNILKTHYSENVELWS